MDEEAVDRIEGWTIRNRQAIEIKHTGASTIDPVDLGDPDFSMEELGEDRSGLDDLKGDYYEESIDIDFGERERELVSNR